MMRVKICGITNLDDATVALESGADLLGFVFFPSSRRYIEPTRAREIIRALDGRGQAVQFVGVFVDAPLDRIRATMQIAQLDLAQLHGSEPVELLRALGPGGYKALRPRSWDEARALVATYASVPSCGHAPSFIVDAFDACHYGGTGTRADWMVAAHIAGASSILLAGGLTAENVAEAIRVVQPWGVDVSSGVERAPGLKDHRKVRQFIAAAKGKDKV